MGENCEKGVWREISAEGKVEEVEERICAEVEGLWENERLRKEVGRLWVDSRLEEDDDLNRK